MPLVAVYDGMLAEVYDAYTDADARGDLPLWDRLVTEAGGRLRLTAAGRSAARAALAR